MDWNLSKQCQSVHYCQVLTILVGQNWTAVYGPGNSHNTGGAKLLQCTVLGILTIMVGQNCTAVYGPGNSHNTGGAKLYCSSRSWEFSQYWWGKTVLQCTVLGILQTVLLYSPLLSCPDNSGGFTVYSSAPKLGNYPSKTTIFIFVVMSWQ